MGTIPDDTAAIVAAYEEAAEKAKGEDYRKAVDLLEVMNVRFPAEDYLEVKEFTNAKAYVHMATALRGDCYVALGHLDEAQRVFTLLARLGGTRNSFVKLLRLLCFERREYAEALGIFESEKLLDWTAGRFFAWEQQLRMVALIGLEREEPAREAFELMSSRFEGVDLDVAITAIVDHFTSAGSESQVALAKRLVQSTSGR